ncbi:solute carrier family 23 member 1-like [Babylonia areolata]|uniref:solute carrier family 23 member 1-like n=1 Tax=Babylonia areolata TaxID=304850 RepID=UPI003FD4AAA6
MAEKEELAKMQVSEKEKQSTEHIALCEKDDIDNEPTPATSGLQYRIDESPPLHVTLLIALQHLVLCFAATLTLSLVIGDTLCSSPDSVLRSQLFSTALGMSGLNTVAQSLAGSRLPVFQGPSFTFISPLMVLGSDPAWSCSSDSTLRSDHNISETNATAAPIGVTRLSTMEKLQQMSGSLMAASAVEVVIGALGLVGPIMRRVGPVTVVPTISLIGLSLYKIPITYSRPCPAMAAVSALLVIVFSLYLQRIEIPIGCGPKKQTLPIFKVLPVLLSICLTWIGAAVLTAAGVFSDDPNSQTYLARTDAKAGLVEATPWLLFTYPGQFGAPSFNLAAFVGFTAAVLSSVVESVGDYVTAARSCEVPPPPQHAVSRGLLLEGVGSVLSGAYGAAHATATYSGNIALLRLCRTGSRSVLVLAGLMLVGMSFVGKVAAAFSTVPEPVLGGVFLVVLGLLVALGLSSARHLHLHSTRNLIVLGVAIFAGIVVPGYLETYPDCVDTGSYDADQVIRVALGTPMIIGGVVACFLDNTVQGTMEERGMHEWLSGSSTNTTNNNSNNSTEDPEDIGAVFTAHAQQEADTYGWGWYPALLRKCRLLRHVPFLPPYTATVKRLDVHSEY